MNASKQVPPGGTIGIIGGGQLGLMLAAAAVEAGYQVTVLDPTPNAPASRSAKQFVAPYSDVAAVVRLAKEVDVLTYEFENVDAGALAEASAHTWVPQGVKALRICQDRAAEKGFLTEAGVPTASYREVSVPEDLPPALDQIQFPAVLKTCRGGYDGKGQVLLKDPGDTAALAEASALAETGPCILEEWVDFQKEISVLVVGDSDGNYACFPPAENIHREGILYQSLVPADLTNAEAEMATAAAKEVARQMGLIGAMGVEMFLTGDGVVVNELAPRPHNSGHYTIEACNFSQYDAHIRAVCGYRVGEPELLSPAVMTNVLGEDLPAALAAYRTHPDWSFHLYGKEDAKPGRKMGHVTALTSDLTRTQQEFERAGWREH